MWLRAEIVLTYVYVLAYSDHIIGSLFHNYFLSPTPLVALYPPKLGDIGGKDGNLRGFGNFA